MLRVLLWPFRRHGSLKREPQSAQSVPSTPYPAIRTASVKYQGHEVSYVTPNYATQWRVDTLFTKEPDTLDWISEFRAGEILVDIGANVGMYSIWAARTRGVRVYAFEPESQNFALLYQNIVHNNLAAQVTGYCAALSDENRFALLYLSEFVSGGSIHSFGEAIDFKLEARRSAVTQGSVASTLDHLVSSGAVPIPNHIKIDVDGLEHKVLKGCHDVLADGRVKSVLVELNTNLAEHRAVIPDLERLGFHYSPDQVSKSIRTAGAFTSVGNHVFRR